MAGSSCRTFAIQGVIAAALALGLCSFAWAQAAGNNNGSASGGAEGDASSEQPAGPGVRVHVDEKTGDFVIEKIAPPKEPSQTEKEREEHLADGAFSFFKSLHLEVLWQRNGWIQWGLLLAAILGGVIAGKIVSVILEKVGQRWIDRGWLARGQVFAEGATPANLALITVGLAIGLGQLRLSEAVGNFCGSVVTMLLLIAAFWYAYNLVAVIEIAILRFTDRTESKLDDQMVPVIRKTLRIFLVVVAVLVILEVVFGANVGAALAGFGIAGLAVSLAAQDSLKNLFGSITIFFDQPFLVGERIIFQGHDGVVEEIGFRSTKVRLFTGNLVTVPNSAIVNETVENPARRPYIRRSMDVTITYDTPREKIEEAVQIIHDILESDEFREPVHAKIGDSEYPPRVYFNDFAAVSLNIFVMYWYTPPAWWDFMEYSQRFNLELFSRYEAAGIEFAFPTQTLYLANDDKRQLAVRMLGADLPPDGES